MYLAIETVSSGGHSRSEHTHVYKFADVEKLTNFLKTRVATNFEIYEAKKMTYKVELTLEEEKGTDHG